MKAMIIGVTGQAGYFLTKKLLDEGHQIIGVHRRNSQNTTSHLPSSPNLSLVEGDLIDAHSMNKLIGDIKPNELYLIGAQSHVHTSFDEPVYTLEANTIGPLNVFEAVKNLSPKTRVYFAATSEMFGHCWTNELEDIQVKNKPPEFYQTPFAYQDENTPMIPNSPYAVSKLASFNMARIYRKSYGLFIACGIMFNMESEMRGDKFVTRKISKYVAGVAKNKIKTKLSLGNLDSRRDWGFAGDYVDAMALMLRNNYADDFVIATGQTYSITDFLIKALNCAGLDSSDYKKYVQIDPAFVRPFEVPYLCGCAEKAKLVLGWEPKVKFDDLVKRMVKYDLENS